MPNVSHDRIDFPVSVDVLVIGAGACGLSAGLAAADGGVEALVLERDATPLGSTAMSTGLIPASGAPEQAARGISDSPEVFFQDIMSKTKGRADPVVVRTLVEQSVDTITWLRDQHAAPLALIDGFLYPGHSQMRMFGTPNRTGGELQAALQEALVRSGSMLMVEALAETIYMEGDWIVGVGVRRPDGQLEPIGCKALVLACCGYAGNPEFVRRWIPEMADAVYHGHPGNKGDAIVWGEALGAAMADMSGYQGHGGLAAGYGIPILWPLIMEGGYQVNNAGARFSDESAGYSEQAAKVNGQPGHVAWSIFDERLHHLMLAFDDYQDALSAGAILKADDWGALGRLAGLPADGLEQTAREVAASVLGNRVDPYGRDFTGKPPLKPPFRAVKVTGALFHTQGGLEIDSEARVRQAKGGVFPNLFAGGGAARGISGPEPTGYLAGTGLMTATTLGKIAGRTAAAQIRLAEPLSHPKD